MINDGISLPEYIDMPDLGDKDVYICNAINPYALQGEVLIPCRDIEYYIVRTDEEFVACITLCYNDSKLMSACLNVGIASILNTECQLNEAIQLVAHDGILYVKSEKGTSMAALDSRSANQSSNNDTILQKIENAEDHREVLSIRNQLTGIISNPAIPRSSKILNVPYVPQVGGTCWAAGASFGQYYTGSRYAHLSAVDLANMMNVGVDEGAYMDTVVEMLETIFSVNTVYLESALTNSAAINLFQQNKPILAGFRGHHNTNFAMKVAHMVVLCGYDDNNTGRNIKYYVRDPAKEDLMILVSYSSGELEMDYYTGYTMYWDESVYYVYVP